MTRDQAIQLLPCYVIGDLPADAAASVEATLEEHADLHALVDQLRDQNERSVRVLCGGEIPLELIDAWADEEPPEIPILPPPGAERPAGRASLAIAGMAMAVAAMLMIALAWSLGPRTGPVASVPSVVYAHETAMDGRLQALDPSDRAALERAFVVAGVPAQARVVPDLTQLGWTTEAVYILPGQPPGSAIEYRVGDLRLLCQMWVGLDEPRRSEMTRQVADVQLDGYHADGVSLVMWHVGEMLCVMTADIPLDQLMALVERRVSPTG